MVSLVLSALVSALQRQIDRMVSIPAPVIDALNLGVSLVLLTVLIAAVYKVLPDRDLDWRDVAAGAAVTALLITLGKVAIGIYIGRSATISGYGAAGSVIAALFFVYYAAQIFLLGAEFTRVYAEREEGIRRSPAGSAPPSGRGSAAPGPPSPRAG
jgi:membrane protein